MVQASLSSELNDPDISIESVEIERVDTKTYKMTIFLSKILKKTENFSLKFTPKSPLEITILDKDNPTTRYQILDTSKEVKYVVSSSKEEQETAKKAGEYQELMSSYGTNGAQGAAVLSALISAGNSQSLI